MAWWFEVVESRHELQNPTSVEKIRLLGERLGLGPDSHVLDMACGSGGPALVLAQSFGCRVTGVEKSEAFLAAAKSRFEEVGASALVDLVHADGKEYPIEPGRYDAALCLGASFIWDGLEQTVAALAPGVRSGGFVAVGEAYWRTWPLPDEYEPDEGYDFLPLPETAARFETSGVELVTLIDSTKDDWDSYESLHWHALEEWLHENPEDREAEQFRRMGRDYRDTYVRWLRDLMGWAIFVGRNR